MQNLTIGRIVHYRLSESNVETVNERADRSGNLVQAGEVVPAIVIWPHHNQESTFNGQAFLDGEDTLWLTSVPYDENQTPGTWSWPPRV